MVSKFFQNRNIKKMTLLRIFSFVAMILVSISYIWYISQVSTQGYYLKDLERKVSFLEKKKEQLEFEASGYRSLSRIENMAKEMHMIKNNKITYMDQNNGSFALSR